MNRRLCRFCLSLGAITAVLIGCLLTLKTAQAADGTLSPHVTLEGNYCVTQGGVGLLEGPNTFTMTVPGTPVHAYLYWSARYLGANNGDNTVQIAFNGGTASNVSAEASDSAYAGFRSGGVPRYYYTYRSANLATLLPAGGNLTVRVEGLTTPEAHGAGLVIISEGAGCTPSRVQLNFGLDGFFWDFTPPAGTDSQVTCADFPSATVARTLDFQIFVGGVEYGRDRGDRIWYAMGSGTKPTEIAEPNNPATTRLLAGPVPPSTNPPYPLSGGDDSGEWDNFVRNNITVPAGATYACFQIESIDATRRPGGTSGVWLTMNTRLSLVQTPGIAVRKFTNGSDAQSPNGADVPQIAPGAVVTWSYLVTNTGQTNFTRAEVTVVDSVEGPVTNLVGGDDGDNLLEPGESWRYTLTGTARTLSSTTGSFIVAGCANAATGGSSRNTYANSVTVTAGALTASDVSHYCNPLVPGLAVRKFTNGSDAQTPNGADVPVIAPGATVTWSYLVTNTGQTSFTRAEVTVVDSVEGAVTNFVGGDDGDDLFEPGETWRYTLTGTARTLSSSSGSFIVAGCANAATGGVSRNTYANSVTATAGSLTASDVSHYCNPLLTATVGDLVWADINPNGATPAEIAAGNGIQDGEEGISGIIVELYTADGVLVESQVTDANGKYLFTNLTPGDYYIRFINPLNELVWTSIDQGNDDAKDSDAVTDEPDSRGSARETPVFTLSEGEVDLTWDGGLVDLSGTGSAAVGNYVWSDLNQNGLQDSGESGVPNITVRLYTGTGTLVTETTTDDLGFYNFGGLNPGNYFVEFILPNNLRISPEGVGTNEEIDSDVDPTTQRTVIFTVPAFTTDLRWDAGIFQPTNLGDEQEPSRVTVHLPLIVR